VKQNDTGSAMAQQLSDGEGAAPTARGGPLGQGSAPRPVTREGGMVSYAVHGGRNNRK
jgi:hypothetical protein